jgi:hypothetical protein
MIPCYALILTLLLRISTPMSDLQIDHIEDFKITGDGSADSWNQAAWIDVPQLSFDGITAQTRVKTLYSNTGIYFLYECEDEKITSTLREDNADLWTEDVIEVFIWTDKRHPIYFEYELSQMNYELPLIIPNIDDKFLGWIPWHYTEERKVQHMTSVKGGEKENGAQIESWTGEFFVPYDLLSPLSNVPPEKGTTWYVNFYRIDYDTGMSTWAWKPVEGSFHQFEKFGSLTFR